MATYGKNAKVLIKSKAQNRTVLGIITAYLKLNPQSTLEDLRNAFPSSINTESAGLEMFARVDEICEKNSSEWAKERYFTDEDSVFTLANGEKIALVMLWTKPSFLKMVEQAKNYGIEVAEYSEADSGFGKRGSFSLEYLNGFIPPKPKKRKKKLLRIIILIIIILILLLLGYFKSCSCQRQTEEPAVVVEEPKQELTMAVADEVTVKTAKEYKSIFFDLNKTDLNSEAIAILDEIVSDMKEDQELELCVEGHASADGSDEYNNELSKKRSMSAVKYIVDKGVSINRLQSVGQGSSVAKNSKNPNAAQYRCVEFKIITNK